MVSKVKKHRRMTKKRQMKAAKLAKSPKCPKGYIMREPAMVKGYTKSDGTRVSRTVRRASCVVDKGLPGKGPQLISIIEKDVLGVFGYSVYKSKADRHKALKKAIKKKGHFAVIKRLTALANLMHRTNPKASKAFKTDQEAVSKMYKKYKMEK